MENIYTYRETACPRGPASLLRGGPVTPRTLPRSARGSARRGTTRGYSCCRMKNNINIAQRSHSDSTQLMLPTTGGCFPPFVGSFLFQWDSHLPPVGLLQTSTHSTADLGACCGWTRAWEGMQLKQLKWIQ